MGSFTITAERMPPVAGEVEPLPRCDVNALPSDGGILSAFDGGFEFTARVSRNFDAGQAYVVIGGVTRDATFDGQVVQAGFTAARRFTECDCVDTDVEETLTMALLSTSQNAALQNTCPGNPLDGGVPQPSPDGGVLRPDTTPRGFDAIRACGELVDIVRPREGSNCQCTACWMRYQVRGVRR